MSVLMETQNPEAHARLAKPTILPGVGDTVVYHMRPHEMRAGKTQVPALVLKVDEDNRLLDLLLFYDQMDMMQMQSVPQRIGTDRGWEVRDNDTRALRQEIEELRAELGRLQDSHADFKQELAEALFGEHNKPDISVEDRLLAIDAAMENLREIAAAGNGKIIAAAPKGKRKGK